MALATIIQSFIEQERLPASYRQQAEHWFVPLAQQLLEPIREGRLQILGVSGSQGSGKSTLAGFLHQLFEHHYGLRVVSLSLDDFYLSHQERQRLASTVHPLLASRGVPGTHHVELAVQTLVGLRDGPCPVPLPRFNKAKDDLLPRSRWQSVETPVDLIILEGWCLGIPPQEESALDLAVNALEESQDRDGRWRRFVNCMLRDEYPALFDLMDYLIFLRAPDFESVARWRSRQEHKLRERIEREAQTSGGADNKIMDGPSLARFMQHFERLTRHGLNRLGEIADIEFVLDDDQGIVRSAVRGKNHLERPGGIASSTKHQTSRV